MYVDLFIEIQFQNYYSLLKYTKYIKSSPWSFN